LSRSRHLGTKLRYWSALLVLVASAASAADTPADIYKKIAPALEYLLLQPDAKVVWTLTPPASASYEVYARWVVRPGNTDAAVYTVHHAGGQTAVTRNQQVSGGQWVSLGTFNLAPDQNHRVELSGNAAGTVIADAVRISSPSTIVQSTVIHYIHTDHLNTPRLITNQAGQAVWRWDNYDPLGGNAPNENPTNLGTFTCNLRFAGQYFDKETNLHYNYFRDYDPAIGQYIQPDPLGVVTILPPMPMAVRNHLYAFVLNNPLTGTDPFGLLTTLGCTPAQTRQLEIAAAKASAAANSPCVACEDRSNLRRRIDDLVIRCTTYSMTMGPFGREVQFCGGVRRGDATVYISPLAFTDKRCGCSQATVIHEAAHTLSPPYTDDPNDRRNANSLARRCFKCAP
jgi:RHS repeat-associated protein